MLLKRAIVLAWVAASCIGLGEGKECGNEHLLRAAYKRGLLPNLHKMVEAPADTDVLRNKLDLEAIFSGSQIIGSNTMTVKSLVNNLNQFHFQLANSFTISSLKLDGRTISFTREDAVNCRANFDRPYSQNEQFTLQISYGGSATASAGFGSINFTTHNSQQIIFTLSEPFYSYTWWPAKDDNTDKAMFDINITIPNTMKVVANGLLQGIDAVAGNKSRYRWSTNYQMAPYLAFFSATNYNTWNQTWNFTGGSMPVQFWIYPEDDNSTNRANWEKCLQMLTTYEPIYGRYPFVNEKYGIYEFGFGGGMEHQTCTGQGTFSESVTSHELGHQWWGDMITCATWHDIWLNESFATYTEALWLEKKPGSSGFAALKSAMANRRPSSVNGSVYCYDISDVNRIFSTSFTYRKGGWVLHMLRHILGDTAFFNCLAQWRSQYAYTSRTTDDFINTCENVAGRDLNWFFDPWVYGIGAPAYNYGWTTTTVNSKNYLLLSVRQNQSVSYPIFTMPIDVRPTVNGVKQNLAVDNKAQIQNYVIPTSAAASALTFDEDAWILSTANTNVGYAPGPPKIVETSPAPGALITAIHPNQIRITFHTPVNANAGNFGISTNQDADLYLPFTYSYDSLTNTAILTFAKPLPNESYELTISDSITAVNSGQRLDGEIANPNLATSLPSGDGIPNGSSVIDFRIKVPG